MAINITLAVAWEGPKAQYDTDDIIDVFRYDGDIPPALSSPWVHIHVLNAPWNSIQEAKEVLLEPVVQDDPDPIPENYVPVIMNSRALRAHKDAIPQPVKNSLNRNRQYTFDFSVIRDAKIYNKKLQRLMQVLDW